MKIYDTALFAGLAVAATLIAAPAFAEMVEFKATLSAAEEVPATTSKGVGMTEVTFDTATKKASWKGTYSGLSGPVTGSHFHGPAEKGKTAGVELAIEAKASPFEGMATLTDAQAKDLTAGMLYVNLHTAANPEGEIRGQVVKAK